MSRSSTHMDLRRVLKFNGTLGMTIPNKLTSVLGLHWKEYVEVYLADKETIVVKRHKPIKRKDLPNGNAEYTTPTSA